MDLINSLNIKNKNVLIRCDFNVPIGNNRILDDYRIKKTIPTITHCLNKGASIILMSHLGRPNKYNNNKLSLKVISIYLSKYYRILSK